MSTKALRFVFFIGITLLLLSCEGRKETIRQKAFTKEYKNTQSLLTSLLEEQTKSSKNREVSMESIQTRYAVVNKIAGNMLAVKDYSSLIPFLTDWVERHEDDPYNAYWLLMTAYAYLENDAEPIAGYYFERIINNYNDLMIQGNMEGEHSVHFICLQHLIQISANSANKIAYFNQLINRFPNNVNRTELYFRLALEYEKEGEWAQALRTYSQYLEQDDAATLQISGYPNAYLNARQLIDFSNSSKDWTFETLDSLVQAVKKAISNYDYKTLDSYKSKVNFFAMSWRQDETDINAQESFSMHFFMRGNRIRYNEELDSSSSPNEAYLRTTGWSNYINVWYLYFKKVNFLADPDIHGRWEWAGIYYGEKL